MLESAIGVDLGGTKALLVSGPHSLRFDTGPSFSVADFAAKLDAFIASTKVRPSRIGIAVPGLVDTAGRVVACDVLPGLAGWLPATALRGLGCEIAVVNDVEAALREELHDAPPGHDDAGGQAGRRIVELFAQRGLDIVDDGDLAAEAA